MSEVQPQNSQPTPTLHEAQPAMLQPAAPPAMAPQAIAPRRNGFSGRQVVGIVVSVIVLLALGLIIGGVVGYRLGVAEGLQQAQLNTPPQAAQRAPQSPDEQAPNNFNAPQLPFGGQQIPANNPGGPYLGVQFEMITPAIAAQEGITGTTGALIRDVVADSPAAQAGLTPGEVVTAVNGQPIDNNHDLRSRIADYKPNDEVTLTIVTGTANGPTKQHDVKIKLGERPNTQTFNFQFPFDDNGLPQMPFGNQAQPTPAATGPYLGVEFIMLTPEVAASENMTGTTGALIKAVMADSPAAQANLKPGDVITAVDGQAFTDSHNLRDIVQSHKVGDALKLTIVTGTANGPTNQHEVTVTLAERPVERQFQMPPGLQPGAPSPGSREG